MAVGGIIYKRIWRSPALARTAARDAALATGPVGVIDLTSPGAGPDRMCRFDVSSDAHPGPLRGPL
eukprot:148975-Prymnesium_polylepis.1